MKILPKIELTEDGSQTLRHPVFGDSYHSLKGAEGEARYVFIQNGFDMADTKLSSTESMNILEVGFGSGLNAWLTLAAAQERGCKVAYTAVELYPVAMETIAKLKYASDPLFTALHEAEWEQMVQITPYFALKKEETDLASIKFDTTFDLVYFDAFAPDTQPELWSVDVFRTIYESLNDGAALVTYSAKGSVKRALREVGFEVHRLKGALGKRHMLRCLK